MYKTVLPIPPSANMLFPTNVQGRRFRSGRYKDWTKRALRGFQPPEKPLEGRLHAVLRFVFPDKRKRDVANFEKGPIDFLVAQGVMHDDCQIDHLELIRGEGSIPGVFIQVGELP